MLTNVVITTKGADDDVADPSTGTDKGNPTVTAISAIPALTLTQGTVRGILTFVAAGIAADSA